jgi:hypothetical protein
LQWVDHSTSAPGRRARVAVQLLLHLASQYTGRVLMGRRARNAVGTATH